MRSLLIIRHAKSDWDNPRLSDFDRPLNERGHKNAADMAERLVKMNILPGLLVSSPALRAKTTAAYFAKAFKFVQEQILYEPGIYEANLGRLINIVNALDDRYDSIALFGHNPGLTYLAEELSGKHLGELPTCAVVRIEFQFESWRLVSSGTGQVKLVDYPKNKTGS